ncbi:MAG TPA: hypothetical protein VMW69_11450 [Spirochaetia bacterium]|nr:hypothetical protein [Spirochaetia bacterium]
MGLEDQKVTTALTQAFETYSASVVAGDPDRWITLWDEQGVRLPPDAPMAVGRDAILQSVRPKMSKRPFAEMKIDVQAVKTSGPPRPAPLTAAFRQPAPCSKTRRRSPWISP